MVSRSTPSPWHGRLRPWRAVLAAGSAALAAVALAQPVAPAPAMAAWTQQAQDWVSGEVGRASPGATPLRPVIEVGSLDSRLRLAPCVRVEPYLPAGTRLWGRSRIGLRCVEGPTPWNVFLPVTVRVWGPAWALRHPVPAGTELTQDDVEAVEIDWTEGHTPVLAQPQDWVGHTTTRHLLPGQVLRQGMVRAPQVFSAGTQVKVTVQGPGFRLSATGEALSHGHVGQTARVRLPNRRVLSGTVRDADTVEIAL